MHRFLPLQVLFVEGCMFSIGSIFHKNIIHFLLEEHVVENIYILFE